MCHIGICCSGKLGFLLLDSFSKEPVMTRTRSFVTSFAFATIGAASVFATPAMAQNPPIIELNQLVTCSSDSAGFTTCRNSQGYPVLPHCDINRECVNDWGNPIDVFAEDKVAEEWLFGPAPEPLKGGGYPEYIEQVNCMTYWEPYIEEWGTDCRNIDTGAAVADIFCSTEQDGSSSCVIGGSSREVEVLTWDYTALDYDAMCVLNMECELPPLFPKEPAAQKALSFTLRFDIYVDETGFTIVVIDEYGFELYSIGFPIMELLGGK